MPAEIQPGHWYLCLICKSCEMPIPALEIMAGASMGGDGSEVIWPEIPCPMCGAKHDYDFAKAKRLQARAMGQWST